MADEKKAGGKITLTNTKANIHYSGSVRLAPGAEVEITPEQAAFVEKNEKQLLESGVLVLKK